MVAARRNRNKNLSDGVVVEASVIARLLGINRYASTHISR